MYIRIKCGVLPLGGLLHSGTELIPLFPYLSWQQTMALQGFLTLRSTQAWAYRSPDKVSLDRRLKFAITCEFT